MRRGKTDPFDFFDLVDCFEKLHKGAFSIHFRELVPPVEIHDLAEQGDFAHSLAGETLALIDDVRDGPGALGAPG